MRSVTATAGGTHRKIDSNGWDGRLLRVGVEGLVEDVRLVGHMEDRRDAVINERRPQPVVVRVGERPAVHRRRGDHPEPHAGARQSGELGLQPVGVAQREVGHGMETALAVGDDRRAPTVPGGHVGGERGQVRREPTLPQQTEVGEEDGTVETHLRDLSDTGGRLPVLGGQLFVVGVLGRLPSRQAWLIRPSSAV